MIGIDTNVLLRFALRDDDKRTPRAIEFLLAPERRSTPAMICPIVLVELVWTLRRRRFRKDAILDILDVLSGSRSIVYSDQTLVTACIEQWRQGEADLQDYLIAALNLQAGASTTVTFDLNASAESGFTLLPS